MRDSFPISLLKGLKQSLWRSASLSGYGLANRLHVVSPALSLTVAACLSMQTGLSLAQEYTWDTSNAPGIQGGSQNWNNTNNNWTTDGGATPTQWVSGGTAVFGDTGGNVRITDTVTVGGMVFDVDGYTIIRNGGNTLNTAVGPVNIDVANAGDFATIDAPITGSGSINVIGPGILVLTRANTYTGLTSVTGVGTLQVNGSVASGVDVVSGELVNYGTVSGGVTNTGKVTNIVGATINGGLTNDLNGTVSAAGTINGAVLNDGNGLISSAGALNINGLLTNSSTNTNGVFISLGTSISADDVINEAGAFIVSNGTLTVDDGINNTADAIDNSGTIKASGTINADVNNLGAGVLNTTGALDINGDLINSSTNTNGVFIDVGTSLTADDVTNAAGAFIVSKGTLTSADSIDNSGTINAAGTINADVNNKDAGVLNTTGALDINGNLINSSTNANGVFIAAGTSLTADDVTNAAGAFIVSQGTLTSTGAIDNSGTIRAEGTIEADVENKDVGFLSATGALDINGNLTNSSTNSNGVFIAAGNSLTADDVTNVAGAFIVSNGTLTSSDAIDNSGTMNATGTINADVNNKDVGVLNTTGVLDINGNLINSSTNPSGVFIAAGTSLTADDVTNAAGAFIVSQGTLTSTGAIDNSGTINAAGTINADVNNMDTGVLNATGVLDVNGDLINSSTNANGVFIDVGTSLTADDVTNAAGAFIVSKGTLTSTDAIDNSGTINAAGIINADVNNKDAGILNATGVLDINGTLTNGSTDPNGVFIDLSTSLTADAVVNKAGATIVNLGTLSSTTAVDTSGTIGNSGSILGGLLVRAGVVNNVAGASVAGGAAIYGGTVNSVGTLGGTVILNGGNLNVNGGGNSVLDDAGLLTVNGGNFSVNGSETIGGLAGTGGQVNIAAAQTLTVNQTTAQSFAGILASTGVLNLAGAGGELTLTGDSSAFGGSTTINGSTLTMANGSSLGGVVSANTGGSIGGSGGTLEELQLNGGTALAGATLKLTGNVAVNSGEMAASLNGQGSNQFMMNGGTFSGAASNFQSFIQTGGVLAAGSTIGAFGFGQTDGTNLGATINAKVQVTAILGTIAPITNSNISATNDSGGITVETSSGAGLNSTGGPVISTTATGATTIKVLGSITGNQGINAIGTGAGSSISITATGPITTTSTAISMASGGSAIAEISNVIEVSPGAAALVGGGNATFDVKGTGVVTAENLMSSTSGSNFLQNAGTLSGAFQSGSGNLLVTNLADGEVNLSANSASNFGGAGDQFINSGLLNVSGSTQLNGLESFINGGGGNLNLSLRQGPQNDIFTMDRLTIDGDMELLAGSTISMDVDLSGQTSGDIITVLGNFTSSGGAFVLKSIGLKDGGTGNDVIIDKDVLLVQSSTAITIGAPFTVTGLENLGLFTYQAVVSETDGTQLVLRSNLDAQAAGGIVSNFITAQNSVSNAFFKPASGFVSSPLDPDRNQLGFSVWSRASGGLTSQGSKGVALLASGPQAVDSTVVVGFGGYQFGLDGGLFNIGDSGANLHIGLTAGQVFGTATQTDYNNKTTMLDTFVGAYGIFSNGPFFVDAQLRQEFIEYNVSVNDRGFVIEDAKDRSQRFSAGVSGGYAFTVGRFSVVPAAGYTFARTTTDSLGFAAGQQSATVEFGDSISHLAFAGVSATTSFLLFDDQLRLSPFISATAYHDFGDDQSAQLVVNTATPTIIDVTSGSGKTYGEVSLGANFLTLTPEIAGTQRLLSGNVRGDVQFGEDRLGGSLNAQLRLQF